jgi:hypothetical protein
MYTTSLQILSERFNYHCCTKEGSEGLLIVDSRTKTLDFRVSVSHVSFLLGNPSGRAYTRLTEAPMFVDSCLSAGVQLADVIGSCLYGYFYQKSCAHVPGLFDGAHPVSSSRFDEEPGRDWDVRVPARDYSHCSRYWPLLRQLEFKRSDVAPPAAGAIVSGYYGFRELGRPAPAPIQSSGQ